MIDTSVRYLVLMGGVIYTCYKHQLVSSGGRETCQHRPQDKMDLRVSHKLKAIEVLSLLHVQFKEQSSAYALASGVRYKISSEYIFQSRSPVIFSCGSLAVIAYSFEI